ncbi:MAG: hypothetical protein NPINA01_25210 [Nitrospinaceae bacterium]|nr:MAG: hypothetical protein NPINA01_25210 [Nitrospinaceae bacterium]
MDEIVAWVTVLEQTASRLLDQLIEYAPNLVGAALIVFAGWIIARLLRAGTKRLATGINSSLDRLWKKSKTARFRLSDTFISLTSKIVFWAVFLFFAAFATRVLGLHAFSDWLDEVVAYLPTFVAGALIIVAGFLFSALVRDLTITAVSSAGIRQSRLFGGIAQGATLATAVVIGLSQVGIDVSFLVTILSIVVAAVLGSLSLSVALGSKALVKNLIGSHYLKQQFQPGQKAKFGDTEGVIIEFTSTSVILATEEGRTIIPAKIFNEESAILILPKDTDE